MYVYMYIYKSIYIYIYSVEAGDAASELRGNTLKGLEVFYLKSEIQGLDPLMCAILARGTRHGTLARSRPARSPLDSLPSSLTRAV